MNKIELIQAIASLCMGFAGDNASLVLTADSVQFNQMKCHAFYAECTKENHNDIRECMIKRFAIYKKSQEVKP